MTPDKSELRVALGGFGAIGGALARRLDRGVPGLRLVAVSAQDAARAARRVAELDRPVPVIPLGALAAEADVVVECAPAAVFRAVALPAIEAGRIFLPVSVGQLLEQDDLVARAAATGARIIVPTGALLGLDAVRAAAEGTIHSVTMVTRKPPRGLAGAPWLEQHGIRLDDLDAPLKVFAGSARDGARGFPANVNVAAALSLAGIGPGSYPARDLGRSRRQPQHPSDPGRGRQRALRDDDRERAERGQPAHRQDHRALGDRGAARAHRHPQGRQLRPPVAQTAGGRLRCRVQEGEPGMPAFTTRPEILGTFGVVTSTHWLASATGMAILEKGGNAFDAAVAAGFALQVVEPHLNGPGGDLPVILYSARQERIEVICGQGTAPAAATIAAYRELGLDLVPGTGLLAAVVPGAFDAWLLMLRDHGSLPLREVLVPGDRLRRPGLPAGADDQRDHRARERAVPHRVAELRRGLPAARRRAAARQPVPQSDARRHLRPDSRPRPSMPAAIARRRSRRPGAPGTRASSPPRSTASVASRRCWTPRAAAIAAC